MPRLTLWCIGFGLLLFIACTPSRFAPSTAADPADLGTIPADLPNDLHGIGHGATLAQAMSAARSDLLTGITVRLHSQLTVSDDQNDNEASPVAQEWSHSQADLPLLGLQRETQTQADHVTAHLTLVAARSLPLHLARLAELRHEIMALRDQQKPVGANRRHDYLNALLTKLSGYRDHRMVALLLGGEEIPTAPMSSAALVQELNSIDGQAPSLAIAAQILTRDLPIADQWVTVKPAVPLNSDEITPFSRALADQLTVHLTSTPHASTIYQGHYQTLADGMLVTYRLLAPTGDVMATRVTSLSPKAYVGVDYTPRVPPTAITLPTTRLAENFRAQLFANDEQRHLAFSAGTEIILSARLNQPGYFYIVSRVKNTAEDLTYLLPVDGPQRLIKEITAQQTERPLPVRRLRVSPPFGVERLTLIATERDPRHQLPRHGLDPRTGYALVVGPVTAPAGVGKVAQASITLTTFASSNR